MSGNNPLVSVIIPAYNHEKYVQETIKSIINQTYQNIELIIVDDGSKDNTWQKIQEMREECEKRFSRVVFETKQNEGTCKTLNRLINLTNGEYIYLIASDDISKPYAIEKEIEFLSNNTDYALVVGENEIIDKEGKKCYWDINRNTIYDIKKAYYTGLGDFLSKFRKFNFNSDRFGLYEELYLNENHVPNGYLIRKSIFKKTGLFTTKAPLEDYWLMLQISKYAKLKYLDEILFSYRWHDTNTMLCGPTIATYTSTTKDYETTCISQYQDLYNNKFLPEVACFFRMNKIIQELRTKNIKLEDLNKYCKKFIDKQVQELSLLANQSKITNTYLRYKLFSKIFFGKKRKHYKEKAKIFHEKVRTIRKLIKSHSI